MSGWKGNSAGSLSPIFKEVRIKARHEGKGGCGRQCVKSEGEAARKGQTKNSFLSCSFFFFFSSSFLSSPSSPLCLIGNEILGCCQQLCWVLFARPNFCRKYFLEVTQGFCAFGGNQKKSTNHFKLEEGHDYNHTICQASPLRVAREELRLSI